jgi:hypothetical protein
VNHNETIILRKEEYVDAVIVSNKESSRHQTTTGAFLLEPKATMGAGFFID